MNHEKKNPLVHNIKIMSEETTTKKRTWKYQYMFNWIAGLVLLATVVIFGIQMGTPSTLPGFESGVTTIVDEKLLPVNSSIAATVSQMPTVWTSSSASVITKYLDGNSAWTTISTLVPNTAVDKLSTLLYRKAGNHVELFFNLNLLQNNDAATGFNVTQLRAFVTLPIPIYSASLNKLMHGSVNAHILGAGKTTLISAKACRIFVGDTNVDSSTTLVKNLYIHVDIDSNSLFNVSLFGSILYPLSLGTST